MKTTLLILMFAAVPAFAQEPLTQIRPADTIAQTTHTPMNVTVASSDDPTAPMIYPNPLPKVQLGRIARAYRAIHANAPKATKIANDEAPIVADEPKEQK